MKHPEPKWILSPVWGLAIDPLNWKLMKRGTNPKTGKPSRWRVVGYYPKLNMLVDSLAEKIMQLAKEDWLNLTPLEFENTFKKSPIKRTGYDGIKRNLKLIDN